MGSDQNARAKQARRQQALTEVERLIAEYAGWHQRRMDADRYENGTPRGQHHTQLESLRKEVLGAAAILKNDLQAVDVLGLVGDVYARCSRTERQILWLNRVWRFFGDKFDQRNDDRCRPLLQAADEVVWSAYRPLFDHPAMKSALAPAPLCFLDADFSPAALRRDQREVLQKKERDFKLVQEAFNELPVPLLKIPMTALANPWTLVLIGHEVGHVVQPLLAPEFKFVVSFQQALQGAALAAGADEARASAWERWADEVFADWYAVLTMGPVVVWAMAQFEQGPAAWMATPRTAYPAPAVRLALMAALAEHHGMEGVRALAQAGVSPQEIGAESPAVAAELALVPALVQAIAGSTASVFGGDSLASVLGVDPRWYRRAEESALPGLAELWTSHLRGRGAAPGSGRLESPRLVAAGAARAWATEVFGTEGRAGALTEAQLSPAILATLAASGPPGTRATVALKRRLVAEAPGMSLAKALARADVEDP